MKFTPPLRFTPYAAWKPRACFATLLKRKLIAPAGHKNATGHALLYKNTRQFLIDFGLKHGEELPAIEEFAKLRERYQWNLSPHSSVPTS